MTTREHLAAIGKIGGVTTAQRYGYDHFEKIARQGGEALMAKYGREYYSQLGKRSAAAKRARKEAIGNKEGHHL